MPTNKITQLPELKQPRDRIKEWLIEKYPLCEMTGERGTDLHEGLVTGNDLKGLKNKPQEVQIIVWKVVLHSPANVFLLEHNLHLNRKPAKEVFVAAVRNRPDWFFQQYPLENWRFKNAELALKHFELLFQTFFDQGIFKTRMSLPI